MRVSLFSRMGSFVSLKYISNNKQSISFVVINILAAFFGFTRSFAFMKFLNLKELGLLTLIQTGSMLIGLFQIGLINGGYRIVALQDRKSTEDTNNVVFSYFGILVFLLFLVFFILSYFGLISEMLIVGISILTGLLLLVNNWLSNILIARREYKRYNQSNLLSIIASVACLPLSYYYGIYGGALCILIQPLFFILFVFFTNRDLYPSRFLISFVRIRSVLIYGFIPYLSGLFLLLYMQIERWSIVTFLGTTSLGSFYLVFLISTLWVLIPTSINNIFFPRVVKYFDNKELIDFLKAIKVNLFFVLLYCALATLIIVVFLSPIVNIVFPQHLPFVKYAILLLPGLICRTLSDPITLVLNSIVRLKPILWSDIYGLIFYFILITLSVLLNEFSLSTVVLCFDLYSAFKLVYLFLSYLRLKKQFMF